MPTPRGVRLLIGQVFNLQRLAVLTTALATSPPDPELIYEAMKDRIHQPYRMALVCCPPVFQDLGG